jgi:hypothetical protein
MSSAGAAAKIANALIGDGERKTGVEPRQSDITTNGHLAERRESPRYSVLAEVRWRCLHARNPVPPGTGESVNISSNGILFTTSSPLSIGLALELSIAWPVALNGTCPLKLVVNGRVTRSDTTTAALQIEHYEFRTRGSNPLGPCPGHRCAPEVPGR